MCAFWVEGRHTQQSLKPEVEIVSDVGGYVGSRLGILYLFWGVGFLIPFLPRVMWAMYRRRTVF